MSAATLSPVGEERSGHVGDAESVCVVGAGYIGVLTTFYLSRCGFKVTCVEKHAGAAAETSYLNGGLFCPTLTLPWANFSSFKLFVRSLFDKDDVTIKLHGTALKDPAFWWWGAHFARNCLPGAVANNHRASYRLATYSAACTEALGVPPALWKRTAVGSLQVFDSEAARTRVSRMAARLEEAPPATRDARDGGDGDGAAAAAAAAASGPVFESLSRAEGERVDPVLKECRGGFAYVLRGGADFSGDCRAFAHEVERRAERLGATFRYGAGVRRWVLDAAGERVTGAELESGDVVRADHFVVAAGNGTPALAAMLGERILSYPVKGYVLSLPVRGGGGGGVQQQLQQPRPPRHIICNDVMKVYACPVGDEVRISGVTEFNGLDYSFNGERTAALLKAALAFLPPGLLDVDRMRQQTCLRPQTPDDLPVIGRSGRFANVWYNAGAGHLGWTRGAGSSQLLCDLLRGATPVIDPSPYDPRRFTLFGRRDG